MLNIINVIINHGYWMHLLGIIAVNVVISMRIIGSSRTAAVQSVCCKCSCLMWRHVMTTVSARCSTPSHSSTPTRCTAWYCAPATSSVTATGLPSSTLKLPRVCNVLPLILLTTSWPVTECSPEMLSGCVCCLQKVGHHLREWQPSTNHNALCHVLTTVCAQSW